MQIKIIIKMLIVRERSSRARKVSGKFQVHEETFLIVQWKPNFASISQIDEQ
jgi:hypothetical protein